MSRDAGYYYVYMLTNASRVVLYIGVTSDLEGRLYEHRTGETPGFTQKYRVNRLVYYEDYPDPLSAITREKQLKGWTRAKKNALVAMLNPLWEDLGEAILPWQRERKGEGRVRPERRGPSTALHSAQDDGDFSDDALV